jgi:hypothetical protein
MTAMMSLGIRVTRLFHTFVSFTVQSPDRCTRHSCRRCAFAFLLTYSDCRESS